MRRLPRIRRILRSGIFTPQGLRLLTEAGLTLSIAWMNLQLRPAQTLSNALRLPSSPKSPRGQGVAEVAKAAARAARLYPFTFGCLPRSLALQAMLRRRHIPALLRVSMWRSSDATAGHAWVEVEGEPVNDAASLSGRPGLQIPP